MHIRKTAHVAVFLILDAVPPSEGGGRPPKLERGRKLMNIPVSKERLIYVMFAHTI